MEPMGEFFFNFLFCIWIEPVDSVVIISGEQGRDSAMHIHASILPRIPLPSRLPHGIEQSLMYYRVGPCGLSILNIAS